MEAAVDTQIQDIFGDAMLADFFSNASSTLTNFMANDFMRGLDKAKLDSSHVSSFINSYTPYSVNMLYSRGAINRSDYDAYTYLQNKDAIYKESVRQNSIIDSILSSSDFNVNSDDAIAHAVSNMLSQGISHDTAFQSIQKYTGLDQSNRELAARGNEAFIQKVKYDAQHLISNPHSPKDMHYKKRIASTIEEIDAILKRSPFNRDGRLEGNNMIYIKISDNNQLIHLKKLLYAKQRLI